MLEAKHYGYCSMAVAAATLIGGDLMTKLLAATIASGRHDGSIVPARNPSFSLGLASAPLSMELAVMAVCMVAACMYLAREVRLGRIPGWAAGLVVGGAAANLIDRAVSGSVHDFIATQWFVFNVADVAVLVGLGVFALTRARRMRKQVEGTCPTSSPRTPRAERAR